MIQRPIAASEPRAFGVVCDPAKFSQVMDVPAAILSEKKYETYVSIDLTEPGVQPVVQPGNIVQRQTFADAIPWIVVSIVDMANTTAGTQVP
jgi:hypothetical protein